MRGADRIAVVEGMHIVEQGTRDELMALDGVYAQLERAQNLACPEGNQRELIKCKGINHYDQQLHRSR